MCSKFIHPLRLVLRVALHGVALIVLAIAATASHAQSAAPLETELAGIAKRVAAMVAEGKRTEADFAAEIAALDTLLTKNPGKTDEAMKIAFAKAQLYAKAIRRTAWTPPPELAVSTTPLATEFNAVEKRMGQKLADGMKTEADFAPEIAELDALLVKYREKTEEAAVVLYSKALFYAQALKLGASARALLDQMVKDYPETATAKRHVATLKAYEQRDAESAAKQESVIGKPAPEIHYEWASNPQMKKLSNLKGRVVIVDFWATWCGPCIASIPELRRHAAHFADSPVTFLGVTSMQGFVMLDKKRNDTAGNPQKEIELTAQFAKEMDMTWDVVIGREKVFNPDYGVRGIPHVAIIAPDGTVRHNGLNPLRDGKKIEEHVTALLNEFKLPMPKAE